VDVARPKIIETPALTPAKKAAPNAVVSIIFGLATSTSKILLSF
jgi:hypothetical protein